jgi:hypothetical protein
MNKEQIIDKVYKRYVMLPKELSDVISDNEKFNGRNYTQEEFINKCKTDIEFSEKWGLKIEEKELSLEERYDLIEKDKHIQFVTWQSLGTDRIKEVLDTWEVPTKLITITYNDKTIESYE